jgi:UDP-N-acetylglucosamine:LPS N-acetylglucosamine transferase
VARLLVVSASMGGGHDGVAAELGRRLSALGNDVEVVDLLALYPLGLGLAMRAFYVAMLRTAPWLYELIYQAFFVERGHRADVSPAVLLALPGLRRLVLDRRPDGVVSTFHLAGQVAGRLRQEGTLTAPSIVVITEASAHRVWRAPGTDLFVSAYPEQAAELRQHLGTEALAPGPVVRPQFRRQGARLPVPFDLASDRPLVLVSAGSWGVGHPDRVAAVIAGSGRYQAVVLCGHRRRCRRQVERRRCPGAAALGWVPDLAPLLAAASELVENAGGGLTTWEAFAIGLPVVSYDPIAGHGRDGAEHLTRAGLTLLPEDEPALIAALDDLATPASMTRHRLRRAAAALFQQDCAEIISAWLAGRPQPAAPGQGRGDGAGRPSTGD